MLDSPAQFVPAARSLFTSKRGTSHLVPDALRTCRATLAVAPVLEPLDGRILLSQMHPVLPVSVAAEINKFKQNQEPFSLPLPPQPVFVSLPRIQQGGTILSQMHVVIYHHIYLANQEFSANTGVNYVERFIESPRPAGATVPASADDTSEAVSAFMQSLSNQVQSHEGNRTEFIEPVNGKSGDKPARVSSGVIEKQSYLARGNHLSFALTYATPDHFVFNEQFDLKAFPVASPLPRSSFSLLDAVNQFALHFQVSG